MWVLQGRHQIREKQMALKKLMPSPGNRSVAEKKKAGRKAHSRQSHPGQRCADLKKGALHKDQEWVGAGPTEG